MPDDARLLELTWLSRLEQGRGLPSVGPGDSRELRLLTYLGDRGYIHQVIGDPARDVRYSSAASLGTVDGSQRDQFMRGTSIGITHAGAVRRAELEQQLKFGRIKEPMGLVWDGRHFRQDTRIALLDSSVERPLAAAYLDLNDVKAFNAVNHDTGDAAIRRYLEIVAELTYDRGDAYRLSGGADEVILLLPRLQLDPALAFVRKLLAALGRERVAELSLRAAAGVVVTTDPGESVDALKARADAEQGRAKAASRPLDGRSSVLAWGPDHLEVVAAAVAR